MNKKMGLSLGALLCLSTACAQEISVWTTEKIDEMPTISPTGTSLAKPDHKKSGKIWIFTNNTPEAIHVFADGKKKIIAPNHNAKIHQTRKAQFTIYALYNGQSIKKTTQDKTIHIDDDDGTLNIKTFKTE